VDRREIRQRRRAMRFNQAFHYRDINSGLGIYASSDNSEAFKKACEKICEAFVKEDGSRTAEFVCYSNYFRKFVGIGVSPFESKDKANRLVQIWVPDEASSDPSDYYLRYAYDSVCDKSREYTEEEFDPCISEENYSEILRKYGFSKAGLAGLLAGAAPIIFGKKERLSIVFPEDRLTDEEKRRYDLEVDREWYEVIDGQQRLTTLALILHYFNEHFIGKSKQSEPTIKYETRQTHINKVSIDDGGDVVCEGVDRSSNIDLYHVVNAYGYIHEWFQSFLSSGGSVNKIMLAFNEHVRVIWYQIDEQSGANTDAIELFTRINMGKIPLTNAELIKALFLRQRNFKDNQSLRQVEIAKEWDSIEYALQNDGVWYFLNNEGEDKPARIEYIFDMMYDSEHNRAEAEGRKDEFDKLYGTDAYKTFRFFAYKFKDDTADAVKRYWEEVMGAFSAIREWYDDNKYYHYIGYLIACGVRIVDVYSMYHNAPKSAFLQRIKDSICEVIKDVKYGVDERGEVYVDLQYGKDNNLIRRVLLLFNVEYIVKHSRQDEQGYMRFPFDLYKKMDWDIEHINSYTTNEISKGDAQVAWINTALGDMKSAGFDVEAKNGDLYEKIEDFLRRPRSKTFYELKAR
jgi:hypothetical protein